MWIVGIAFFANAAPTPTPTTAANADAAAADADADAADADAADANAATDAVKKRTLPASTSSSAMWIVGLAFFADAAIAVAIAIAGAINITDLPED